MSYEKDALRTESIPGPDIEYRLNNVETVRLLHAGMGMATEAGEFLDALKKHIYYGASLDTVNLMEEVGDLFWYLAIAADVLNVSFEEIQKRNTEKLRTRYPEKFTSEHALNRNLNAERETLD